MYTQFFGNYLLSKGYITQDDLFSALKKKSTQRIRLGTLAIHAGLMTASEVDDILIEQTHQDKKFGELTVEMGYLTKDQVHDLLSSQSPDFLLLGQILVDDGVIDNTTLENAIVEYRSKNEMLELDMTDESKENVEKLFDNFLLLDTPVSNLGKMYIELLFNNFIRFVGEDFTPVLVEECVEFTGECFVQQEVLGEYAVASYISMDEPTAIEFASRYVNDTFYEYDEYVKASLEDFLNLNNGLFIVNCSNDQSLELNISAPLHFDNELVTFEGRAYHIQVLYTFGTVHYILDVKKTID